MQIIQVKIEHLNLVAPLFDGYRVFYGQKSDLALAESFLRERIEQKESIIFVAMESENAIGFTQLYPSFSSVSAERLWILNDLFVLPEVRGKGVGEAILNHAKQFAKATNSKGLSLETAENNPAQKLYEKLNWQKEEGFFHYFWKTV